MDVPVLKYLDVLIGLSFVMILGCTVVAAATQLLTSTFYLRAQDLRQGLADLLQQLDPTASSTDCEYAAQLIQRHPLVSRSATVFGEATTWMRRWFAGKSAMIAHALRWLPSGAPAETLRRDELVRIVLEWAAGDGVLGNKPELEGIKENLRAILRANGVSSPGETLTAIERHAVSQERAFPERPAHLWNTAALIEACPPALVGKVTGWFDAMAARTSQRFTLQSKLIGAAMALLVTLALPLDSLDLIRRLSDNPQARDKLLASAQQYVAIAEAEKAKAAGAPAAPDAAGDLAAAEKQVEDARRELAAAKARLAEAVEPLQLRSFDIRTEWPAHLPGLLLSWTLLALGTPFWYDLLKNLLKLRSVTAQSEEKERAERQGSLPSAPPPQTTVQTAAAGARTTEVTR